MKKAGDVEIDKVVSTVFVGSRRPRQRVPPVRCGPQLPQSPPRATLPSMCSSSQPALACPPRAATGGGAPGKGWPVCRAETSCELFMTVTLTKSWHV